MEYQKIMNLLDNASNQPSKFRENNWVEINDESRGGYNVNSQVKFKTTMLKSSLCDYSDVYILVKGKITVNNTGTAAPPNNRNKKVLLYWREYNQVFIDFASSEFTPISVDSKVF